jgi:hypothetical protein
MNQRRIIATEFRQIVLDAIMEVSQDVHRFLDFRQFPSQFDALVIDQIIAQLA